MFHNEKRSGRTGIYLCLFTYPQTDQDAQNQEVGEHLLRDWMYAGIISLEPTKEQIKSGRQHSRTSRELLKTVRALSEPA